MIKLVDYSKLYKNKKGIKNISLKLEPGNIYGLVGPNGSGKTTLLNSITGFTKGKGLVEVFGEKKRDMFLNNISYMPDEDFLLGGRIKELGKVGGILAESFNEEAFITYVQTFGIDEQMTYTSLSKGQKMCVKVAYTLSRKTSVYIFDEPLSGIDLVTREIIVNEIVSKSDLDTMIVVSSHELHDLDNKVDKVVFLNEGEVLEVTSLDDLKDEFRKELSEIYVSRFSSNSIEN